MGTMFDDLVVEVLVVHCYVYVFNCGDVGYLFVD